MAGQPRKRAMIRELEKRARERECSVLEYAVECVESGWTLTQLVESLNDAIDQGDDYVTRAMVSRYLNHELEGADQLAAARRGDGAHGLAESALTVIDEETEDKVQAARNKTRAEMRLKLAGFWNRQEYGEQRGPSVAVNLDLGQLHIDALRQRRIDVQEQQMLPPAAEGQDYEVMP